MRHPLICLLALALLGSAFEAEAGGRILKVLPEFLDSKGRTSLAPSLYERDAYQAQLRAHPNRRTGEKFYIQWKTTGPIWEPLTVRLELRGTAQGKPAKQLVIDTPVENLGGPFSRWTEISLAGQEYKDFGGVTAWRATLWEGSRQLGEQRSFLW